MTGYADALLSDFELRDDLQVVSLTNAVSAAVNASVKARGFEVGMRESMMGGSLGIEPTDWHWSLGCLSLAGTIPNRGDKITDVNGSKWIIISMSCYSFGGQPIYYSGFARPQR